MVVVNIDDHWNCLNVRYDIIPNLGRVDWGGFVCCCCSDLNLISDSQFNGKTLKLFVWLTSWHFFWIYFSKNRKISFPRLHYRENEPVNLSSHFPLIFCRQTLNLNTVLKVVQVDISLTILFLKNNRNLKNNFK